VSQSFQIADLQHDDTEAIEQIAAMMVAAFPHWLATLEQARAEVRESFLPGHLSLVARAGDEILGWVGGIPAYAAAWELHPLVVREETRGQGIGGALVAVLEERVRERGALTLYLGTDDDRPTPGTSAGGFDLFPDPLVHAARLEVIDHPVAFYRRQGFVVVGLIPDANGPGKPDILMAKRIAPPD
jgi:aminoglycoside 6'-N-acetyltransferase I